MLEMLLPREFPGGRLRRLCVADLTAFQFYRSIPELGRYQSWSTMSDPAAAEFLDAMNWAPLFKPGKWVQLGIAESATDALIGDIGVFLSEDGSTGEVGFTLRPSAQRRGVASLAVREALNVLFTATSATRVLGITDERNLRSIRLLERLGFEYVESRQIEFRGEPCVEKLYALLRQ
jgi:ribosomal-protein-alanine N-acetyltransferase